jgi:TRAP transporter TAXI family solute receptor
MWLSLGILLSGVLLPSPQARPDTLTLVTGAEDGSYLAVGRAIADVIEDAVPGISVRVLPSNGSVENIRAIGNGDADLAIAQNDVAYYGFRGEGMFTREFGMVEAIMGLHPENVLVIERATLGLSSAARIRPGMRVVVGRHGSGTLENARDVLGALGLGMEAVDTLMREPRANLQLLGADSADILFLTGGVSKEFWEEVRSMGGEPVSLGAEVVEFLERTRPYYRATTFQVGGETFHSVRVRALLLANSSLPAALVGRMTRALYEGLGSIRASHPAAGEIIPGTVREYVPIRWHQGANEFYCDAGLGGCPAAGPYFLGILVLLSFAFLGLWYSETLRRSLLRIAPKAAQRLVGPYGVTDRYRYLLIPVLVSVIILVGAFLIRTAEVSYARAHNVPSEFEERSATENLLWTLVFTATGFEENVFPRSPAAKVLSAMLGWVGIGGVILLVGLITSDRLARKMKMQMAIDPKKLAGHVMICGWNARAAEIISKLTDAELGARRQAVVVLADLDRDPVEEFELSADYAAFMRGSPTDLEHLRRAGLDRADTVIVLADENADDPDAQTVLTVLQAEKHAHRLVLDGERTHELRTVAELADPKKKPALESVHTDVILCPQEFSEKILLQTLLNPGLTQFLGDILTVGRENQIIEVPIQGDETPPLVGKTFDEAMRQCREKALLLLAIHCGGAPGAWAEAAQQVAAGEDWRVEMGEAVRARLLTNPHDSEDRDYRIRRGDSLLLLAHSHQALADMFGSPGKWKQAFKG